MTECIHHWTDVLDAEGILIVRICDKCKAKKQGAFDEAFDMMNQAILDQLADHFIKTAEEMIKFEMRSKPQ